MNVFELFAKIGLDTSEYDTKLGKAAGLLKGFGGKVASTAAGFAKVTAGAMTAVTGATATAVVGLTKQASSAYANYEQLVGGVDKLFGKSSEAVQKYADQAFSTAGLSANEYMETVTNFSASLISGLNGDTKKAADLANQAIIDMSDNANTFGTDITSIQNAYQGFAKQNYTMLDNLKLGYGGTAAEMARLINESGVLGEAADEVTAQNLNEKVSFDQMIEAIHITQERMNIAGTTSKEAAGTISGSLSSVKSAWSNLVTELGKKNGDIAGQVQKLVKTIKAFAKNIMPTIKQVLKGIGQLIKEVLPEILVAIPEVLGEMVPEFVMAITDLIEPLTEALTELVGALAQQLPALLPVFLNGAITLFTALISALDTIINQLMPMLPDMINQIVKALVQNLPILINGGLTLMMGIVKGVAENADLLVQSILDILPMIAEFIGANLGDLIAAGLQILMAVIGGILGNLDQIGDAVVTLIGEAFTQLTSYENLKKLGEAGKKMLKKIWDGFAETFAPVGEALVKMWEYVSDFFKGVYKEAVKNGEAVIAGFVDGMKMALGIRTNVAPDFSSITEGLNELKKKANAEALGINTELGFNTTSNYSTSSTYNDSAVTLRLTDGWDRVVAEGTTSAISLLQGEAMQLMKRGLAQ